MSRFGLVRTLVALAAVLATVATSLPASAAPDLGSLRGVPLSKPIVGIASTPSGVGYWLVASDGGIFTFGDAPFLGSTGDIRLNQPVVGMAATASGGGYWMVARDGGIFTFGDAPFLGSTGDIRLNQPIAGMTPSTSGSGYAFVARDGGLFNFGDAAFHGSGAGRGIASPFVGMAGSGLGGYWLAPADGDVLSFGPGGSSGTAGPAAGPTPSGTSGSTATATAKQGGITHPSWWNDEYLSSASDRMLGEIASTGAGWVVIVPTWYQATRRGSVIAADPQKSASDAAVRHAINVAHELGLKVLLKPHVDLQNDSDWRGNIRPDDPDAWFASYRSFIGHFADMATSLGVEELSVGTELVGVSGQTSRWRSVIGDVRSRYDGPLTYAANFDEYASIQFWDALDLIGVDAYFELSSVPTADVGALGAAWQPIERDLAAFSARWSRPILFTEAGYTSQVGTATEPWNWLISEVPAPAEQAAGYEALFRTFWDEPWFAGVHWWMWDDFEGGDEDQALDYTPRGKPAEGVLRSWFA